MFKTVISGEHWLPHPRLSRKMTACLALILSFMLVSGAAFGQGTNASLSGTVADASRAVLPNASVTAFNNDTNMESKTTANNSGVYSFANLPPGTYTVTAEAAGFQRSIMTDVRLRAGTTNNLNFDLSVMGTTTEVEVIATAESMVLEAGASTGSVLQEDLVTQLPVLSGSLLDLVGMMGGVVTPPATAGGLDPVFSGSAVTFAGVSANNINIVRDGISVNEIRFESGINSPNRINQEMVSEFRMILSPVDAEMGRGAGQVQMTTRSGGQSFHGSGVWNIQNTALDANEWGNKHRDPDKILTPAWRNLNNYTLTASGPIRKNQTFFFLTWDQQIAIQKDSYYTTVLTPCARKGIYRYLDGVISSHADAQVQNLVTLSTATSVLGANGVASDVYTSFYTITRPSVNYDGSVMEQFTFRNESNLNPTVPNHSSGSMAGQPYLTNFGGLPAGSTGYSGVTLNSKMYYNSVFGQLSPADRMALGGSNAQTASPGSSVYGNTINNPGCENYNTPGTTLGTGWDVYRNSYDASGFVKGFTDMMPLPNDWTRGDGLNTAAYRWTRRINGFDTVYGTGDANRSSITLKIDHNLSSKHRLSGTYSYEAAHSDDDGVRKVWPDGYNGRIDRTPQTFQFSAMSTLTSTLMNEFRVGLSRTNSFANAALASDKYGEAVQKKLDTIFPRRVEDGWKYTGLVVPTPGGAYPGSYGHFLGSAYTSSWGSRDNRWTVVENITWIKGAHSFKGGLEFRNNQSFQEDAGNSAFFGVVNVTPSISGGVLGNLSGWGTGASYDTNNANKPVGPLTGAYPEPWEGLSERQSRGDYQGYNQAGTGATNTTTNAYNLLTYLSGSVASVGQFFFTTLDKDTKQPRWNDPSIEHNELLRINDLRSRELHLYFKDDWKLTSDLTLNLGVRWEYYGVPYEKNGLTAAVSDYIDGAYGISRLNPTWMSDWNYFKGQMGNVVDYDKYGTRQIYMGPNSTYPNLSIYNKDLNNFAPHVGFSWALPWFGKGKTTLRGGYSISYSAVGTFTSFRTNLLSPPGVTQDYYYSGEEFCNSPNSRNCYLNFSNIKDFLPLDISKSGYLPVGVATYTRANPSTAGLFVYDPDVRNPYIQNINLSVTRNLNNFITLDVRYIGTLQRKSIGSLDLNTVNYFNNGVFDELEKLRSQNCNGHACDMKNISDFPILNSGIIPYRGDPNDPAGTGYSSIYAATGANFNATMALSGAEQVLYNWWNNVARGQFQTIAEGIRDANYASALRSTINPATGIPYRRTVPTNETATGVVLRDSGSPDTLFKANPQYANVYVQRNSGRSNYHSMQTQVSIRPTHGLSLQATWTWSRSLSRGGVIDYRNWETSYNLSANHRKHALSAFGSYELPFGTRGLLFRDASGTFKKAIEGWSMSWVASISSGNGMGLSGVSTIWGSSRFNQVGAFDPKDTNIKWYDNGSEVRSESYGTYFNKTYGWIVDPVCDDTKYIAGDMRNPYGTNTLREACGSVGNTGSGLNAMYEVNPNDPNDRSKIIFVNALPGTVGNQMNNIIMGPTRWSFDAAMAKSIEFMEGKRFEFRLDAQNLFNHAALSYSATPTTPTYFGGRTVGVSNPNISFTQTSTPFGYFNSKAGHRTFQAKLSLRF